MFKKKIYSLLLLATTLLVAVGCQDDDAQTNPNTGTVELKLEADIDGLQQVPSNPSPAKGTMTGTYNKATRKITYTIHYTGMVPTSGHFHQGAPGTNGPVSVPFANVAVSPIEGEATLLEEEGASLLKGEIYINLHRRPEYANGEIRGLVKIKPQ